MSNLAKRQKTITASVNIDTFFLGSFKWFNKFNKDILVNEKGELLERISSFDFTDSNTELEIKANKNSSNKNCPETILIQNENAKLLHNSLFNMAKTAPKRHNIVSKWMNDELPRGSMNNETIHTHFTRAKRQLRQNLNLNNCDLSVYKDSDYIVYSKSNKNNKRCSLPGCNNQHRAKGLCHKHYALTDDQRRKRGEKVPVISSN